MTNAALRGELQRSAPVQKRSRATDPMAEVVDRLLAQLSGAPSGARNRWAPMRNGRGAHTATIVVGSARDQDDTDHEPTTRGVIGLWARVTLVLLLGVCMTLWPYPHDCGVRLFGYAMAVATVLIAGSWAAFVSWRRRNGYAHVLALILAFWGVVLAAEELLPRIGYAAEQAAWQCSGEGFSARAGARVARRPAEALRAGR